MALSTATVTWTSSDPHIASVQAGVVTAQNVGTAVITATATLGAVTVTGTSTITVIPVPVASVIVSPATAQLTVGGTTQLTATAADSAGSTLTGRAVAWTTSNSAVATVSTTGLVTAIGVGTADITATSEGKSGKATITVSAAPAAAVASVTVSLAASSIVAGTTTQATATARDASGNVLTGHTFAWTSSNTAVATVSPSGVVTGVAAGSAAIIATTSGVSGQATVTVTAASNNTTCSGTTLPAVGSVVGGITGTSTCVTGGTSGADYALVAFYGTTNSFASQGLTVRSSGGATPLSSASISAPSRSLIATRGLASRMPGRAQLEFDAKLRNLARRELTPRIAAARSIIRQHAAGSLRPAFTAIPANPTVGSIYTLNAQAGDNLACSSPINIAARVVAVSSKAVVVADTANPAGGFTDAEYASFATTFDTLIDPLDVANFGSPTDIDGNGKVIIFFTKEVNKLTPKNSTSGYIGGFFFERDLFPTTSTPTAQGCPTSNVAEMYYSLVPDPNGIYSLAHAKSDVQAVTPGTLAHEFQHLINAGRRLYVNNAPLEVTWLNEGLSHIAEELLYYKVAGLAPRENISASVLGRSQASVDAFNGYQADNTGRYETYLEHPTNTASPYADDDSLHTRGATWDLLRYLADHRGSSDADTWFNLVNSSSTGLTNLSSVFGSDYMTQINNWAVSVFADDLTGQNDTRYSQPSWNYRDVFPHLQGSNGQALNKYPLIVWPLGDSSPVSLSIVGGGVAFIRFSVPAGSTATIDWSSSGTVSALMNFSLVRSR